MTRAMLRRPFTALRTSGATQAPEYYGKSTLNNQLQNHSIDSLELILTITDTWGDPDYCGLTGLEVVDVNDADCLIQSYDARPRDISVLHDQTNAVQTLDK